MATTKGSIKWRPEDIDQLRRQIKNFNAKVDRLMKKGTPEVKAALPPKMSMKTAKAGISSRSDYNKLMKSIGRFTERGSEAIIKTKAGVKAPKFELKEIEARVRSINAERRKARQRLGAVDAGNKPLMGRIKDNAYLPKKAAGKVKPKDWEEYKKSVMKQSAPGYKKNLDAAYKGHYMTMLDNLFTDEDDAEDLQMLKDKIDSMSVEDFIDESMTDDVLYIQFYRDPLEKKVKKELIKEKIMNMGE